MRLEGRTLLWKISRNSTSCQEVIPLLSLSKFRMWEQMPFFQVMNTHIFNKNRFFNRWFPYLISFSCIIFFLPADKLELLDIKTNAVVKSVPVSDSNVQPHSSVDVSFNLTIATNTAHIVRYYLQLKTAQNTTITKYVWRNSSMNMRLFTYLPFL